MSSWRVAPAVKALLQEANRRAPSRSKVHDGTIGDTAHSRRRSDHNPDEQGWVYAGDLTDDDAAGIDCRELARQIVARKDRRVKYLIHEGQIVSGNAGPRPWVWRAYSGANGHFKHLHVSVLAEHRNDTSPWWDPPTTPASSQEDDIMFTFVDPATRRHYLRDGGDTIWLRKQEDAQEMAAKGVRQFELSAETAAELVKAAER